MKQQRNKQEITDARVIINSSQEVEDGKPVNSSVLKAGKTFLLNVKETRKVEKNKKIYEHDGVTVMTRKDGSLVIHVSVQQTQPSQMKSYYSQRKKSFNDALEVAMLTNKTIQSDEI